MMYRPFIPQRVVEGTCVLEGPKFKSKVCRRCGYRRNRAKVMPRYAWCESDNIEAENTEKSLMQSASDDLSTVANITGKV